jgi:hypothetical protein
MRACPRVLVDADSLTRLPRLGGMARPDGVVIVSERFWAFAGTDGTLREGEMPRLRAQRVPLLRGLGKLAAAVSPVFRRRGVAGRREKQIFAAVLIAPLGFVFLPSAMAWAAWGLVTIALLAWLFRGRTLRLHGAEHRAIAAAEERRLAAAWEGSARPSRFSLRCGTNFAALVIPVTVVADTIWPFAAALYTPILISVLSLGVTMDIWRAVQSSGRRLARIVLLPGLGLQRLTTREPSLSETQVALNAVAAVLRRELS